MNTYAHVLPTMQKGAAEKMNRIFTAPAAKAEAKAIAGTAAVILRWIIISVPFQSAAWRSGLLAWAQRAG